MPAIFYRPPATSGPPTLPLDREHDWAVGADQRRVGATGRESAGAGLLTERLIEISESRAGSLAWLEITTRYVEFNNRALQWNF